MSDSPLPPTPDLPDTVTDPETSSPIVQPPSPSGIGPKRVDPAWILISAVKLLRPLVFPLAIAVVGGSIGNFAGWVPFVIAVMLGLGSIALQALSWWFLTYQVTATELRVRSGLIFRQERSVPLERIHAVDSSETPLQRLLGVVQLKVETAAGGGENSDVLLEALSQPEAETLRRALARRRVRTIAPDGTTQPARQVHLDHEPELIRKLSTRELFVAGLTSGRIGPALAILAAVMQFADDLMPEAQWERWISTADGFSLRSLTILVVIVAVGAVVLAGGGTMLALGGFELRREGDRLLVSYGLLDRRRSSIPIRRVQAIHIEEGVLRQPFHLASIRVESAGYGQDTADSGVLFPLIRRSEISALIAATLPAFETPYLSGPTSRLHRLPKRALPRYLIQGIAGILFTTALAIGVAYRLDFAPWWWGALVLLALPMVVSTDYLAYRDAGWQLDPDHRLILRNRRLDRRTMIAPRRRIQYRSVLQGWRQRPAHLATLRVRVASGRSGGGTEIAHLDATTAFTLLDALAPIPQPPERLEEASAP